MANRFFGTLGDLWKHLVFVEVLKLQQPSFLWESHAGSAWYEWEPSHTQEIGLPLFLPHTTSETNTYSQALQKLAIHTQGWQWLCPGSPWLSLFCLNNSAHYLFCDLESESLQNIQAAASSLKIPSKQIQCVENDGVATLLTQLQHIESPEQVFAYIDPYLMFRNDAGPMSPLNLFVQLTTHQVPSLLWFGYNSRRRRHYCWQQIRQAFAKGPASLQEGWALELRLNNPTKDRQQGLLGCVVWCIHTHPESYERSLQCSQTYIERYQETAQDEKHLPSLTLNAHEQLGPR